MIMRCRQRLLHACVATLMAGVPGAAVHAQGGDKALMANADVLFDKGEYAKAYPMYSQLVSLAPQDHVLNYKFGACTLYGDKDKAKATGYLKYAVGGAETPVLAWYFLGKAYQLDYQFDEALAAYNRFKGTADKKLLAQFPVEALEQQCRNGKYLLNNIKDIDVMSKVEVAAQDFFRFYDLSDIGGKIVVAPEELLSSLDRKSADRSLVYLPDNGGPIYFSSYGKDGKTGKDIYRTQLLPTGGYAAPMKLAGYINSDQDEDYAVMAPDGRTFYFCSKGHNSMGGYDVFKSTYDKGMDVFSAPENMDFAVNTPADEMLYIVGPDGQQACFASDRDSKQGMVSVFRVGTDQVPINITVFKGVFSSTIDPGQKQARIIVEDDLTRRQVADVRTDAQGGYVLALPKAGKYKILVQAGGSGPTYLGTLEVPQSSKPQAFNQEIGLVNRAGVAVDVKSHFDQPLDADIMTLALEEIRKRARLDLTGEGATAQAAAPSSEANDSGDPLQAAGFDGTVTMNGAMALARDEAAAIGEYGRGQENMAKGAWALAQVNAKAAEEQSVLAANLVGQAASAAGAVEKRALMEQAALARQRSGDARERALAAYRAGNELAEAGGRTAKQAAEAEATSLELERAQAAKDVAATTAALSKLKAAMDQRKGPQAAPDDLERMRRAAKEAAEVAERAMRQATAQREEEGLLQDRVARLEKEAAQAKGRKKEDLQAQQAGLTEQYNALHAEVEEAFAKARDAEEAATVARGQARLLEHLRQASSAPAATSSTPPGGGMEQRLAQVKQRNSNLAIDVIYLPLAAATPQERERRMFNWGGGEATAGIFQMPGTSPSEVDGGVARNGEGGLNREPSRSGAGQDVATVPHPGNEEPDSVASQDHVEVGRQPVADATAETTERAATHKEPLATLPPVGREQEAKEADAKAEGRTTNSETQPGPVTVKTENRAEAGQIAGTTGATAQLAFQDSGRTELPGREGQLPDEQAFLLANKLAELEQLRRASKNRSVIDSLDREISAQKQQIKDLNVAKENKDGSKALANMHQYRFLDFDLAVLDSQLVEDVHPGFFLARQGILDAPGTAGEKAAKLHALETQLMERIDARMQEALATMEEYPDRSAEVLPRLERLRGLKATHAQLAEQVLADAGQQYAAPETKAMEDRMLAMGHEQARAADGGEKRSATPHSDSYLAIEPELERIYRSALAPRSGKVVEATSRMERELESAETMQAEIDSMQNLLSDALPGKEYDRLRERTDRKIDDLLIHNVDLGQRSAFISISEYASAQDSLKQLSKLLNKKGLPPDEPLLQMAKSYEGTAGSAMARAKNLRRQADDGRDIFKRNSLYRQAYKEELSALQELDRAITVRNYLISAQAVPGETLTYAQVEQRLFPEELAAAQDDAVQQAAPIQGPLVTGMAPAGGEVAADTSISTAPSVSTAPAVLGAGTDEPDSTALARYLDRFYYLDPLERRQVMSNADEKRYFLMRGHSMNDRASAAGAADEAEGAANLAAVLQGEAQAIRSEPGGAAAGDRAQQVQKLETRADALLLRADSLKQAAARLAASADATEAQASVWLQSLPADRSSAIMGLEQTKRRTEPVLARSRPRSDIRQPETVAEARPAEGQGRQETPPAAPVESGIAARSNEVTAPPAPGAAPVTREEAPGRMATVRPATNMMPEPFKPLTKDVFAIVNEPEARQGSIPMDAPLPSGVVYKVQVGAFRNPLPAEAFSDMAPLRGEHAANGLVRYTAGLFTTAANAAAAGAKVRERGYRDAFVVAYMDGRRVTLREAMQAESASLAQAAPAAATEVVAFEAGNRSVTPATQVEPPSTPTSLNAQGRGVAAEAAVLATYPATVEDVLAAFDAAPPAANYYNDPAAAPAKQVETVKGLFFTVQVGVYSKPTPLDRLFNITPLNSELTANGKIRYTTGMFLGEPQASQRKNACVSLGVVDAFITAYLNGKRIPLRDARALLAKFGKSILAQP